MGERDRLDGSSLAPGIKSHLKLTGVDNLIYIGTLDTGTGTNIIVDAVLCCVLTRLETCSLGKLRIAGHINRSAFLPEIKSTSRPLATERVSTGLNFIYLQMAPSLVSHSCSCSPADDTQRHVLSELNNRVVLPDAAQQDALGGACTLPTLDLSPFLAQDNGKLDASLSTLCDKLADCLSSTGCLIVKDPRVASEDNSKFVDLMERYFGQAAEVKGRDARPELHYQVPDSDPGCHL